LSAVDELHTAIAACLHRQRRPLLREAALACRVCGAPVDDDAGGLYNLDDMQAVLKCREHYVPF
jgi:hypothetical protein